MSSRAHFLASFSLSWRAFSYFLPFFRYLYTTLSAPDNRIHIEAMSSHLRSYRQTDKRTNGNEPRFSTSSTRRPTLEKSRSTFAHVGLTGPCRYAGLSSGRSSYLSPLIFLPLTRRRLLLIAVIIFADKGSPRHATQRADKIVQLNIPSEKSRAFLNVTEENFVAVLFTRSSHTFAAYECPVV